MNHKPSKEEAALELLLIRAAFRAENDGSAYRAGNACKDGGDEAQANRRLWKALAEALYEVRRARAALMYPGEGRKRLEQLLKVGPDDLMGREQGLKTWGAANGTPQHPGGMCRCGHYEFVHDAQAGTGRRADECTGSCCACAGYRSEAEAA